MSDLDKLRAKIFTQTGKSFGACGRAYATPMVSVVAALVAFVLAGVIGGLGTQTDNYHIETSITELWIQRGTRMESEYGFFSSSWGLSEQHMLIMKNDDHANGTATATSLDAVIETMLPLVAVDESAKCGVYDGTHDAATRIEAACATLTVAVRENTLYCMQTCQIVAMANASVVSFVDSKTNNTVDERHLCDTLGRADPDAQVFLPSRFPASPAYSPEFKSTSKYQLVLNSVMPAGNSGPLHIKNSPMAQGIWATNKDAMADIIFDSIKNDQGSTTIYDNAMAALHTTSNVSIEHFQAYYSGVGFASVDQQVLAAEAMDLMTQVVVGAVLASYGSWLPTSYGGEGNAIGFGYSELAACAAENVKTHPDQYKLAVSMAILGFSPLSLSDQFDFVTKVQPALVIAEAAALTSLNTSLNMSTVSTKTQILTFIRDSAPAAASLTWAEKRGCGDAPTITPSPPAPAVVVAGGQAVGAYFGSGGDFKTGPTTWFRGNIADLHVSLDNNTFTAAQTTEIIMAFLADSTNMFAMQDVILRDDYSIVLTTEKYPVFVAFANALAFYQNGTNNVSTAGADYYADVSAVAPAYANVLGPLFGLNLQFLGVLQASGTALQTFSMNIGAAVIKAPIAAMSYSQVRVYFEIPTVGFKARPLPRNWGIDRFPCSVAGPTDIFREGDYGLPYSIKQLSEISAGVAGYLQASSGLGLTDCTAHAISGGHEAVYSSTLGFDFSGETSRANALKTAECAIGLGLMNELDMKTVEEALAATSHDNFTAAMTKQALPAAHAYLSAGGSVYNCGDDVIPSIQTNMHNFFLSTGGVGTEFVMSSEEIGVGMFEMFKTLALGNPTSPNYVAMAMSLVTSHSNVSAEFEADTTLRDNLTVAFAAAIPSLFQCATLNTTDQYQCSTSCPGVAVKQVEQSTANGVPLCVPDTTCLALAFGSFQAALNPVYYPYMKYYTPATSALSHMSVLATFVENLVKSAGTALAVESAVGGQLETLASTVLVAMGFRTRPTYGSHRTALLFTDTTISDEVKGAYMSNANEAIVNVRDSVGDAVRAYYFDTDPNTAGTQRVDQAACLQTHQFPDGSPLRGCLLTWASTFYTPDLVFAKLDFADEAATTLDTIGANGINKLGYHRTVLNEYSAGHWLGAAVMDSYLNETTTAARRADLHKQQAVKIQAHLKPLWNRKAGSGFGKGEEYENEELFFLVSGDTGNVLGDDTDIQYGPLIGCMVVMVLMLGLVMTNWESNIESHFWVGLLGVAVIGLSLLTTLGAAGWIFEIPFTPATTRVAPFVILGIGIDDMLVISRAFVNHAKVGTDVSVILQGTLAESGSSVTFTTVTNLVAFGIASIFRVRVVEWFCQVMCVAVVVNWLYLFLLFLPILALDAYRVKCKQAEFCCPHKPGMIKYLDVTYFMKNYYGPFLMRDTVRAAVIILGFGFFFFQLGWGLSNLPVGLRNSDVLRAGTAPNEFYIINEDYFTAYSLNLVTESDHFDESQTQIDIQMATRALAGDKWVTSYSADDGSSYIQTIAEYADPSKLTLVTKTAPEGCGNQIAPFATTANYTVIAKAEFHYAFARYMEAFGVFAASAFICENTTTQTRVSCFDIINAYPDLPSRDNRTVHPHDVILIAAYDSFYLHGQKNDKAITDAITSVRESTDDCYVGTQHKTFTTGYTHIFWDQYLHTLDELVRVVGFAILGVFVVTFLFQFSVRSSLLIVVVVIIVVVELVAIVSESATLKLNAFSVVNLAIAVGLAIELTAHTVHQFLAEKGKNKKERVINTLVFMGWPMFYGGVSTLITSAFLAASEYAFIRAYYFEMFFGMTLLAMGNGMILVPVLLSLPYIGDTLLLVDDDDNTNNNNHNEQEKVVQHPMADADLELSVQKTVVRPSTTPSMVRVSYI